MSAGGAAGFRCLAILAVAAVAASGCEPPPEVPPPRLVFSETAYDFGGVAQGTPVEHRFVFRNEGGAPLGVIKLRAACDCKATLVGDEVAPGAVGVVVVRCDLDAVYGPQRRTVTVYSNDPAHRAVMLVMAGEVQLDVAADPPQAYLGTVPPGAPTVRVIPLRSGGDSVRFGVPATGAPQLKLQLAEAADGSGVVSLNVGTAGDAEAGPFTAVIRVPTTSARHPVLAIPVAGIIAPGTPAPRGVEPPAPSQGKPAAPPGGRVE